MLYESLKVKGHELFRHQIIYINGTFEHVTFVSLLIMIFVSPNPIYELVLCPVSDLNSTTTDIY